MKNKHVIARLALICLAIGIVALNTGFDGGSRQGQWTWLLSGQSTDSWRSTTSDAFPDQGWEVSGNVLTVLAKTETTPGGKDIISRQQFSNFELELEFRLTEGANSGIKYFVVNTPEKPTTYLGL